MQVVVEGRDLRRIKWLVQALFGRLGMSGWLVRFRLVCVPELLEAGRRLVK
jgi:hypothetical protein